MVLVMVCEAALAEAFRELVFSIVSGKTVVGVTEGVTEGVVEGVVEEEPRLPKVTFLDSDGVGVTMLSEFSSWLAEIPILLMGWTRAGLLKIE